MTSNGKLSFLQGRAGNSDTYTLQLFQQCADSKGHTVLNTLPTEIAVSLHENGRTLHNLLGLGVDDKD